MLAFIETELPSWVAVFERVGPGTFVLLVVGGVAYRLTPSVVALLAAWKAQSERITESVPKALEGLRDLVQHAERIADHVTRPSRGDSEGAGVRGRGDRSSLSAPLDS